jgi:hypothetical protein
MKLGKSIFILLFLSIIFVFLAGNVTANECYETVQNEYGDWWNDRISTYSSPYEYPRTQAAVQSFTAEYDMYLYQIKLKSSTSCSKFAVNIYTEKDGMLDKYMDKSHAYVYNAKPRENIYFKLNTPQKLTNGEKYFIKIFSEDSCTIITSKEKEYLKGTLYSLERDEVYNMQNGSLYFTLYYSDDGKECITEPSCVNECELDGNYPMCDELGSDLMDCVPTETGCNELVSTSCSEGYFCENSECLEEPFIEYTCVSDGTVLGCHQFDGDEAACIGSKSYTGWSRNPLQDCIYRANESEVCRERYGRPLECDNVTIGYAEACTLQLGCVWEVPVKTCEKNWECGCGEVCLPSDWQDPESEWTCQYNENELVLPNGAYCSDEDGMMESDCLGGFECHDFEGRSECFMAPEGDCVIGENIEEWQLDEWNYWGFVFDQEAYEQGGFNFGPGEESNDNTTTYLIVAAVVIIGGLGYRSYTKSGNKPKTKSKRKKTKSKKKR